MRFVYTHENRILVSNAQNILEIAGIPVVLKNEYAVGGIGDLGVLDTWLELWVIGDQDYEKAVALVAPLLTSEVGAQWTCDSCKETNGAAFDFCWNCQREQH